MVSECKLRFEGHLDKGAPGGIAKLMKTSLLLKVQNTFFDVQKMLFFYGF